MSAILLVRHGQASFGAEDYDVLSERGVEQAKRLGQALRERVPRLHLALTGTQRRHLQTAEACLAQLEGAPAATAHPGFNEFDHHEVLVRLEPRFEDRLQLGQELLSAPDPRARFQELFTHAVARWTSGQHDAEYSESWGHFRQRSLKALHEVAAALPRSSTALVFTSGGPITAIAQALLGTSDAEAFRVSWLLVNCGVTKLVQGRGQLRLSTLNEHAHFEGEHGSLLTYR